MNKDKLLEYCIKITSSPKYLLTFFIVLGFILRIYKLDYQSLWIDELDCVTRSINFSFIDLLTSLKTRGNLHSPAYYIILNLLSNFVEINDFWARLPSVVFGVFTIPLVYYYSIIITKSKQISLTTTFLWLFSGAAIYFSREARGYQFLTFMTLITTITIYQFKEVFSRLSIKKRLIYGSLISFILTTFILFDPLMLILIISIIVYSLTRINKINMNFYFIFTFPILLSITFYQKVINYLTMYKFSINTDFLEILTNYIISLIQFIIPFQSSWMVGSNYFSRYYLLIFTIILLLIIATTFLFHKLSRENLKKSFKQNNIFLPLIIISLPVFFFITAYIIFNINFLRERYLLYTLPSIYLFLSITLHSIRLAPLKITFISILMIFFIINHFIFNSPYNRITKTPLKQLLTQIKNYHFAPNKNAYITCLPYKDDSIQNTHYNYYKNQLSIKSNFFVLSKNTIKTVGMISDQPKGELIWFINCNCHSREIDMNIINSSLKKIDTIRPGIYENCQASLYLKE